MPTRATFMTRFIGGTALLAALTLAACQSATTVTTSPSVAASSPGAATPTQTASGSSDATGSCLSTEVLAAIHELSGGNMDPDPGRGEVADALEALDLSGAAADARDAAVGHLRENPPGETQVITSILELRAQTALPEC